MAESKDYATAKNSSNTKEAEDAFKRLLRQNELTTANVEVLYSDAATPEVRSLAAKYLGKMSTDAKKGAGCLIALIIFGAFVAFVMHQSSAIRTAAREKEALFLKQEEQKKQSALETQIAKMRAARKAGLRPGEELVEESVSNDFEARQAAIREKAKLALDQFVGTFQITENLELLTKNTVYHVASMGVSLDSPTNFRLYSENGNVMNLTVTGYHKNARAEIDEVYGTWSPQHRVDAVGDFLAKTSKNKLSIQIFLRGKKLTYIGRAILNRTE